MRNLIETLTQLGWQTSSQLKQLGFTDIDILSALQNKTIQKQGQRRGTRYNVEGSEDYVKNETFSEELKSCVMTFIKQRSVSSAGEIVTQLGCDKVELRLVIQNLIDEGEIVKSGAKKGTVYHVPEHVVQPKVKEPKVKEPKVPKQKSDAAPRKTRALNATTNLVNSELENSQQEELELSL